ncbi:MAG: NAD-dependent epimerase/dehydratase family protein [Candidatus Bathyarchaeota archaeon]
MLTGSSGMIGTRLFEKLLQLDHDVIGIDRKQNKWNKSLNKRTSKIDLLKQSDSIKLPDDIDFIIHLAANARVYELVQKPELALENMVTTFNVLEFARKNKVNKIIFSSSREIYGNSIDENLMAEDKVKIENCESPYSASKISAEALIHAYRKAYEIDFAIIRFTNIYGMYDGSDRVIPLWIRQAIKNENLIIYGENKVLDFTYIDDAINGVMKIIKRFDNIKAETFNIAYGKAVKLTYVANKIRELLQSESKIIITENRLGEVWKCQADISKAAKLLDYEPKVGIDEGLAKTVEWYKKFEKGT